ncbi:hypothetical protein DUNSADRAFT_3039 [Dunaliella salina]|uniref:RING-CH-type domain-containing protein n=1 Tax=Dunaliella salina TaxID=3046 RepID=A0ABQ7GUK9_DUNSA|nr:hypothetical protein DUNSADRAFT_3039 [Dunaliella salina]|eukprot:KAF5838307.1 hypothetical protein DUNSADRAFT_3039 [Dunaliella salina]
MQHNEGPSSIVSSSTASLNSTENRQRAVIPSVEVDTTCSSPGRNQSLRGSACSSPAGMNHVAVHVGQAHDESGDPGVNASQEARGASRPQSQDNKRGSGGEARAADTDGGAVNGGAADKNGEGDAKQGLRGLLLGSFKHRGSTDRVSSPRKGADERPLSAGMTECRICLSTEDAEQMVSACACSGTQKWAHMSCLSKWVCEKRNLTCELCNTPYSEPYSAHLQQEINKHPVRRGDDFGSLSLAGQAQWDSPAPNAAVVNSGGTFGGTPLTNPWSRIDYWLTLLSLLAALIVILYFASRNWQVIVWGVIVAFVPITAGLSLLYMLVGKAVENRRWRQREGRNRENTHQQAERGVRRRGSANITFSPFVNMHV